MNPLPRHPAIPTEAPLLLLFTEHRNATWYINFELPLAEPIAERRLRLHTWAGDDLVDLNWEEIRYRVTQMFEVQRPHAVLLSRYVHPFGKELLALAKMHGITSYFHIDDWLFALPADLGDRYRATYDSNYLAALQRCLMQADTVLASTEILAQALAARLPGKNIERLSGVCYSPQAGKSFPSSLRRFKQGLQNRRHTVIGYMGSSSHLRDLASITPALENLLHTHPDLRFETLGLAMPERLLAFGPKRVRAYGYTKDYPEFLQRLYELRWDIGLAPLVDDAFNQCKTMTKLVEYTACGIPVLAAAIEPYLTLAQNHSAVGLAAMDQWVSIVDAWLCNPALRKQYLYAAEALCETELSAKVSARRLLETLQLA